MLQRRPSTDTFISLLLALAALALYGATLAPSVATVFDDSLEFQVVLPTLGIAHPTGYPLYTLLGWVWSRGLPVGDLAYRVNLLSALAAALTVGLLYLLARRLDAARWAAALAAALFAISPVWWSQATVAEVYTLHGLFVALILLLTLLHHPRAVALACGLALTHHRTALLLLPGAAIALLWGNRALARRPRTLLALALISLAPLLLYLYLPLRGQTMVSLDGARVNTWAGFWRHVLASDYTAFLNADPLAVQRPASFTLDLMAGQMGWVALGLGVIGWLRLLRQPRPLALLAAPALATLLFVLRYRTADVQVFYLPLILIWAAMAAVGMSALQQRFGARLPASAATGAGLLLVALVLIEPMAAAWQAVQHRAAPQPCAETLVVGNAPALNPQRRGDTNALNCGLAMLDQPLAAPATLIGLQGETTLARYLQISRGLQPALHLMAVDNEAARLAAVAAELAAGRAVYLTREVPGLAAQYSLSAAGPLVRVWPAGTAQPPAADQTLDLAWGDALRLVGFRYGSVSAPLQAATWVRIEADWHVLTPVVEELKVSARLLRADGSVAAARDAVPVHWAYPSTAWRAGEIISDTYDFALPAGADPAALSPLLILYRAADGSEVGRYQP